MHDLFSTYGEFLPSGNDPTKGQVATIRHNTLAAEFTAAQSGSDRIDSERVGQGNQGGVFPVN